MWRAFLLSNPSLRIEISRCGISKITLIHRGVCTEIASDLHRFRSREWAPTVIHIASTAMYTGKWGYPPTYTQACQCRMGGLTREHR